MLQIVASLIDAARGVIYDHHMFIVQATALVYGLNGGLMKCCSTIQKNVFVGSYFFILDRKRLDIDFAF